MESVPRPRGRPWTRGRITGLLASLAAMLLVSGPLLNYLFVHRASADGRIGELSGPLQFALRGNPVPLAQSFLETTRALLWDGTQRLPYHYNVPGRPVMQLIWAAFFVVGLLVSLVRLGHRKEFLLLVALLLGLGPTLLTSPDATYMRSIYALPLLFIIAVRGSWRLSVSCSDPANGLQSHSAGAPSSRLPSQPSPSQDFSSLSMRTTPRRISSIGQTTKRRSGFTTRISGLPQATWTRMPAERRY